MNNLDILKKKYKELGEEIKRIEEENNQILNLSVELEMLKVKINNIDIFYITLDGSFYSCVNDHSIELYNKWLKSDRKVNNSTIEFNGCVFELSEGGVLYELNPDDKNRPFSIYDIEFSIIVGVYEGRFINTYVNKRIIIH